MRRLPLRRASVTGGLRMEQLTPPGRSCLHGPDGRRPDSAFNLSGRPPPHMHDTACCDQPRSIPRCRNVSDRQLERRRYQRPARSARQ